MACDMPEPCKFRLLTIARSGSCGPTRKLILLRTQSLVFYSKWEIRLSFLMHLLGFESLDPFFRVSKQGPCFTAVEENGGDKRLLELDLAPDPAVGLLLQAGDAEKFPHALESLDPFFRISKQGPCFTAVEENGGDERLVQLELACKADGVALPEPDYYGHCRTCISL